MPSLFATEKITGYAKVVVERAIDRYPDGLTYAIPAELSEIAPGDRVVVPLGRGDRPTAGYVIELIALGDATARDLPDPEKIKPIAKRDKTAHRLPGDLIALARWIAGYYCAPIGMVFASMLPGPVKRGVGRVTKTLVDLPKEWRPGFQPGSKVAPDSQGIVSGTPGFQPNTSGTPGFQPGTGIAPESKGIASGRPGFQPNTSGTPGFQPGREVAHPPGFQPIGPNLSRRRHHLPHWEAGGSTYFVTFNARPERPDFNDQERQIIVDAIHHWHGKRMHLLVATVMQDHVHLLMTPLEQSPNEWFSLSQILHSIKSYTANKVNRLRGDSGPLWLEEYFDRIIRSEEDFLEKWNYIWENPLRAGLVDAAEKYPFTVIGERWEQRGDSARLEAGRPVEGEGARLEAGRPQQELQEAGRSRKGSREAAPPRLSPQQTRVLEALRDLPTSQRPVEIRTLATLAEVKTLGPIHRLIEKGLLAETTRTAIEAEWLQAAVDRFIPDHLTGEQTTVLDAIIPTLDGGFAVHLIKGVTGSGKTEIYIRLIEEVIAKGKVALVLVPEIALTPQTSGRLIGRFPEHSVAVLHSGLTAAQRNQQWTMVAEGRANVILGARSAVFAPIEAGRLGLVIVDEEHDGSYKQDQAPRYHGRDVAIRRGQIADCPVVLGSATPSLESWWNATGGDTRDAPGTAPPPRYHLHRLTQRVPGTALPKVHIVDFRQQMRLRRDRRHVHLIGAHLDHEIKRTLRDGHQILLLLNRRGYANYIACPDHSCGWVMQCEHCDTTMVYHRDAALPTGGYVRCHHCLAEQKVPATCPQCAKNIVKFGLGTQRVEDELAAMFPQLVEGETMMRVDSDTMQSAKHFHDVLGRFARGDLRLLVGTQMIAKGLDFPGVRLVGVINADTSINLPDFRASERTFQLVNQVAGRCGRGATAGTVVVQSFQPSAPAIQRAAQHDFEGFAAEELDIRREFGLPPVTRMARIVVRHEAYAKAVAAAAELANRLRGLAGDDRSIRFKGPAPCPISRIAGRHRQQIEIIAPTATGLQRILAAARSAGYIRSDALMAVDVDPIALL